MDLWHQILEFFGVVGESGKGYGFWSGVGSDIGELAIVGGIAGLIRQRNCHVSRCWRLGRHKVTGTEYIVCRKHHPDPPLTHAHLLHLHKVHLAKVNKADQTTVVTPDV